MLYHSKYVIICLFFFFFQLAIRNAIHFSVALGKFLETRKTYNCKSNVIKHTALASLRNYCFRSNYYNNSQSFHFKPKEFWVLTANCKANSNCLSWRSCWICVAMDTGMSRQTKWLLATYIIFVLQRSRKVSY